MMCSPRMGPGVNPYPGSYPTSSRVGHKVDIVEDLKAIVISLPHNLYILQLMKLCSSLIINILACVAAYMYFYVAAQFSVSRLKDLIHTLTSCTQLQYSTFQEKGTLRQVIRFAHACGAFTVIERVFSSKDDVQ
ncbi:hypothetical protein MKW98_003332 [Papaver atlanticum]|uniref:Uncharacterized protein n=1 Tax=Papaver atlanticum TaxID=357466 RepID=A0AAD4XTL8_9MAGN|nr:hypothetical protein MKW98_003332 [Papaver atlanticum]